jgi:hypothetical protein
VQVCGVCRARAAQAFAHRVRSERTAFLTRRRRDAAQQEAAQGDEGGTGTGKDAAG